MKFSTPLIQGTILKRYKRFLADIKLDDDDLIIAHVANTGSMKKCWGPNWPVLLSFHDNPKRKLKYSLEMTHNGQTWIGVNTSLPNKLGAEAIKDGTISELSGFTNIRPEIKIGESRIDLLLHNGDESDSLCYVEIKNVTLKDENKKALFPDSVTTRGQKHLRELIKIKESGHRAAMLYIIQREDIDSFSPATEIDPEYSRLLIEAKAKGVEILAYGCKLSPEEIFVSHPISVDLG